MSWWDNLLSGQNEQLSPTVVAALKAQATPGSAPLSLFQQYGEQSTPQTSQTASPVANGTVSPADASLATQQAAQSLSTQTPNNMAATAGVPSGDGAPNQSRPYQWQPQAQQSSYPPRAMAQALQGPQQQGGQRGGGFGQPNSRLSRMGGYLK